MDLTGGKSRDRGSEAHVRTRSPRGRENAFEVSRPTPALPQPPRDLGILGRQKSPLWFEGKQMFPGQRPWSCKMLLPPHSFGKQLPVSSSPHNPPPPTTITPLPAIPSTMWKAGMVGKTMSPGSSSGSVQSDGQGHLTALFWVSVPRLCKEGTKPRWSALRDGLDLIF